ncbi:hypothetical protein H2198_005613 [Neophaeococcomyces mojaviensis]|uniref:Uncharacterized protein n=1 Tax=Neophaeococcomyces mojaviensis TaxID=3383035 RepID=A0ACC3A5C4_9EURO|nr:hypothetical protein H2198_005613 [Knufia sp. JES_112]
MDPTTSLLELCQRATNLANSNSTRTVEYLTISKGHQSHGFRDLAINFLELCQTLWPIQAGLVDASATEDQLPTDVVKELTGKVTQTIEDFDSLDYLLSKLLIYERKKGWSKFTKGLGLMNVDTEITKLSASLAKGRDSLRMGSLVFKWVLGDTNLPSSIGSAYTSLATALEIADGQKLLTPPLEQQRTPSIKETPKAPSPASIQQPPKLAQLPPPPDWQDIALETVVSQQNIRPVQRGSHALVSTMDTAPSTTSLTKHRRQFDLQTSGPRTEISVSPVFDKRTTTSTTQGLTDGSSDLRRQTLSSTASQTTVDSLLEIEEMLASHSFERNAAASKVHAFDRNPMVPSPVPVRRTIRQPPGTSSPSIKTALITAVQQKNHQALGELLDTHISQDSIVELNLLSQAILNADCGSVRLLLISGADPNRVNKDGLTPLFVAFEMSVLDIASVLLKYGADPNMPAGPNNESPVSLSVVGGNIEFLEMYIKHGGDVNALLLDGDTSFIKAMTRTSSAELVELMLKSGADPNRKTKSGKSPLLEALMARRLDIVTLLLDHGANPNLAGPKHPLWPATHEPALLQLLLSRGANPKMAPGIMELSTSMNSIEAVKVCLKAGIDPNIKKDGVYTPLCSAIRDDRGDIVTLLLANGANPNVPASEYPAFKCVSHNRLHLLPQIVAAGADLHTPKGILEVAVTHKNKEALTYLLAQGVNPNDRNSDGYTALTTAIRDSQDEMIDILLKYGASPAIRGQDWPLCMAVKNPAILRRILPATPKGYSAKGIIEIAVVANEFESIKMLIAAGFNVEDKTGGVFSPLTSALREERTEIVRYLLDEAGADINAPGEHLPIVKALRRCRGPQDTERIEMLLERGADINLIYRGWNGVMQAVEKGDIEILRLLIEKSRNPVDLQVEDGSGTTVQQFVQERGWEEGAAILLGQQAGEV